MSPVYALILPHAAPFAAVLARLSGMFLFAPLLASQAVPARFKALMALALALVVYPTIDHSGWAPARLDLMTLIPVIVGELAIGGVIGFIASLPFLGAQIGGLITTQQMGMGLADVFNPAADASLDTIGQFLYFMAITIFLTIGGMEALFGAVVNSFDTVALGGLEIVDAPIALIVGLLGAAFSLAMRVAAPILCILMLENMAVGFIMKTVPQLNILSFGFPVKILGGLFIFIMSMNFIHEALQPDIQSAIGAAFQWVRSLAGA